MAFSTRIAVVVATVWLTIGVSGAPAQEQDQIWEVTRQRPAGAVARDNIVGTHAVVRLNKPQLDTRLSIAGREGDAGSTGVEMTLPMPDGTFRRYRVKESPMLAPELAAAYPEIRTYSGQGIDDPGATIRFGWTSAGFHSILLSGESGTVYIDPYEAGNLEYYVVYRKSDYRSPGESWMCQVTGHHEEVFHRLEGDLPVSHGTQLRTYRLAIAATAEYTAAAGGVSAAVNRIAVTMNRVNGIYVRDLAIFMTVATGSSGNPTSLIFTNGATDPYSNNNGNLMLAENQATLDGPLLGSGNYDIGHVFSTGGGGIAYLGSPCNNFYKAGGVTGSPTPTGDGFDVDYVAHEIGHQFGGNHTYNGSSGSCTTREASAAYEVGSGATIQAYAGICDVENLQPNSIDRFHAKSLEEMTTFITTGGGSTCGTASATGNTPPTVAAMSNYTIPVRTPFMLTASATDANGDSLTYAWEQYDLGPASTNVATASTDDGSRPLFRPYDSTTSPTRYFPSLTYILNQANMVAPTYSCAIGNCLTGETLPTTSRIMNFRVTARDNRTGGGAITTGDMRVTTVAGAGPFVVTSQSSAATFTGGGSMPVTWLVNGTDANGINAATVTIAVSTDGGQTFSTVVDSTPNDGAHTITVPNVATTQGRVRVQGAGNIFFDVNSANFTIEATAPTGTISVSRASLNYAGVNTAGTLSPLTGAQSVVVTTSASTISWTASANQPWVQITNGSGTGLGTFTVSIINPSNVLNGVTSATATVTVTAALASNSPQTTAINLTLRADAQLVGPFGVFDTPATNTSVQGSIAVTGWALDDVQVDRVEIWRDLITNDPAPPFVQTGHPASGKVFIANGTFVDGTRGDVEGIYATSPLKHRAGWGYLLLTWGFPNANGTFVLTAIAWDKEGRHTVLGTKTITVTNSTATKPFGSIDVPAYGATFSGHQFTFGWALTPNAGCTVAGGQQYMTINSAPPTFPVTYGSNRTDIASAFAGFPDSNGAGGAVALNSLNYPNGTYAIGWLVYDSCNNGEGIGSRFFTILNGATRAQARAAEQQPPGVISGTGPSFSRVGRAADAAPASRQPLWLVRGMGTPATRVDGDPRVWLSQTGRIELHATHPDAAPVSGVRYEGYLDVNGELRPLPLGSSFDAARGTFFWQPVAGFLGTYHLRIVQLRGDLPEAAWTMPVEVGPEADRTLLQVDATDGVIRGWALDPQATDGPGIGYVHVWVQGPTGSSVHGSPRFVGAAILGHHRQDVGDRYGRQFDWSGFSLSTASLPTGTHDVVVYAWNLRTGRWDAASATTVTVK